ncbi:YCF48-related protein [Methylonatrum kenyense]|uniref:WD40/YVTN/BNR-like repeat-containing protein n=1 Tax=Methylonatrum kenyense TaxID=455253 RepID=UPI0020BEF01A|nr:YCF48-related protein [Methylonatrum kenyense]MCK8514942.1 YCF48-related protein [Methylonatrum kenyense]
MLRLIKGIGAVMPWAVIAGLLFAAVFIQPQPAGESVQPPPIERRDRFYGLEVLEQGSILWAVGSDGKIVRSDDAGENWQVQQSGTRLNLQSIAAWDTERAVAVGNEGVVLVTEDGGETWEQVEAPRSEIFNKLVRVIARADGEAWAVGGMSAVFRSRDYGRTWERTVDEEDISWNGIAFVDDDRAWAVGEFGMLLHSTDGGNSWTEEMLDLESSLMAVRFRDNGHGVAVGLEGIVLYTSNGGEDWARLETDFEEHLFDVTWNGSKWLAVGEDGVVVRGEDDGNSTWVADRLDPDLREWHTTIAVNGDAIYISGATFGRLLGTEWQSFTDQAGERQ